MQVVEILLLIKKQLSKSDNLTRPESRFAENYYNIIKVATKI